MSQRHRLAAYPIPTRDDFREARMEAELQEIEELEALNNDQQPLVPEPVVSARGWYRRGPALTRRRPRHVSLTER